MNRILFYLSVLFFFSSCHNISFTIDQNWQKKYPIEFSIQQHKIKDLIISSQLRSNTTGDTLLCLLQFNPKNKIRIEPLDFKLQTPENYKCTVFNAENALEFDKQTQLALLFSPVNDRAHFLKTGEKGFLQKQYQLRFHYQNKKYKIDYLVKKEDYKKYAQEIINSNKISYYSFFDTNQLIEKQKEYSSKLYQQNRAKNKTSHHIHFTDQEISHNGIIIKCNPYISNQKLFLNLKIVNHGENYLDFDPNQLQLLFNKTCLSPIHKHQAITLRKGERYTHKYQFGQLAVHERELKVDLSAFSYTQTGQKIFAITPKIRLLNRN